MARNQALPLFLGVCESAQVRGQGIFQDLRGISDMFLQPFFPQSLAGMYLLLAVPVKQVCRSWRLVVAYANDRTRRAWSDLHVKMTDRKDIARTNEDNSPTSMIPGPLGAPVQQPSVPLLTYSKQRYKLAPVACPPLLVLEPTEIIVILEIEGTEHQIGRFQCEFCQMPPISEEERKAIKSTPGAIKWIWYGLRCKQCHDEIEFCLPLDEGSVLPEDTRGQKLLANAPEVWSCRCKADVIPLRYLKQGLHHIFRTEFRAHDVKSIRFIPFYEKGAIEAILERYQQCLIEHTNDEEAIQRFIEEHDILWNFLAPRRIWDKPSILTKYRADFGILDRSRVLYFVEIEKPATRLIKADGGISAELQAGIDQIRDWRIEVEKRREAVLSALNLEQKDVHDIRYVLVAGMATETSIEGMEKIRKLKDADLILCFDELASFLHSTRAALTQL